MSAAEETIFYVLTFQTTEDEVTAKFDQTLLHMIEICAALSLASVDHLHIESDTDIYIEKVIYMKFGLWILYFKCAHGKNVEVFGV